MQESSQHRTSANRMNSSLGVQAEHVDHDHEDAERFEAELDAMEGGHVHDHEDCAEDGAEDCAEEGVDHKMEEEMQQGPPQFYEPALDGAYPIKKMKPMKPKKRGDKKPMLRSWLAITSLGETSVLQADKYKLTARLGIQTRDLRLLDPQMSNTYPSAILCRDKSIVVNLEHIKVIITMDRVLVVNHEDEGNTKFVEDLKQRIMHPSMAASKSFPSGADLQRMERLAGHGKTPGTGLPTIAMSAQLPFELRVLEVCLDELASEYDLQTTELESVTYPALDSLAAKVTSPNLEKVRRLKNRLVRLTTRVETVREVLEKFLDDDEDMHDLNLTANHGGGDVGEGAGGSQGPGGEDGEEGGGVPGMGDGNGVGGPGGGHSMGRSSSGPLLGGGMSDHHHHHHSMAKRLSGRSSVSSASTDSSVMESEVAEVEMLLEAYFMHFDNTYNRLTTLNEYIKDTEDLVNIKLDQHRNQLITTDLILTAFTCSMAMVTTIAGIFGMNLDSGLQEAENVFNQVTIASCVGALLLFVLFVIWAWRYGLLVFN